MNLIFHWIYGRHSVEAALQNADRKISRVVLGNVNDKIRQLAKRRGVAVEFADSDFFDSIFGKSAIHQKCAAHVSELPQMRVGDVLTDENDLRPIIMLDQITDPQNIGSILRAGAVFDARAVIVQNKHSPELSAVSVKTSSGASELIPMIRVTNLANTIQQIQKKGFWSVGLDERGDHLLSELPVATKYIIIIGAEGTGMRKLTKNHCDFMVKIPSNEKFSTLNAAQAATVCLYEIFKLRGLK